MTFKKLIQTLFLFFVFDMFALTITAAPWINLKLTYDGAVHNYQAESVYLFVNGTEITNLPMPPIIINSTTLVPARESLEPLGAVVDWKSATNEVFVAYGDRLIILKIGSNTANVNGNIVNMSVPPKIINNKTMIPVRFIAESFELNVNWNNDSRTINITENIKEPTTELTTQIITEFNTQQQIIIPTETTNQFEIPTVDTNIKYNKTDIIDFSYNQNQIVIKTENEMEKFTQINSSNNMIIAFDIYNTLPSLPDSIFNTTNSAVINRVSFTVVQESPFPITRVIVEMKLLKEYNVGLSSDRKEFIIEFDFQNTVVSESSTEMTTQAVTNTTQANTIKPAIDTSKYTKCSFNNNFNYDALNKRFVISKASGNINLNNIKTDDDYLNKMFKLTIPYDYNGFINEGLYLVLDTYIDSVVVERKNGSTDFVIFEKAIMVYDISEDNNNIYIKVMKPKEKYNKIVVVDAGHGGHDDGASGNGLIEKNINLTIAKRLIELLEKDSSIKVYGTRLTDVYYTRPERSDFANELGDLFVSIHINSFTGAAANGTEVWYYPHSNDKEIGFSSEKFASITQTNLIKYLQSTDRGIKDNNFDVLVLTKMPAILCEIGFITNVREASLMNSADYQQKAADAIYQSILEVFNTYIPKR